MTNKRDNKTLVISSPSFLKNICILITVPILFLCDVLNISDVFKNKCKSYLNGQEEELEGQETKTNLDEDEDEEEGLIEIYLEREAKEVKLVSKEEYYEEILEEIEEEDDNNMIEIDISIGSIVTD